MTSPTALLTPARAETLRKVLEAQDFIRFKTTHAVFGTSPSDGGD